MPTVQPSDSQKAHDDIYIGKQPAIEDDVKCYLPWQAQGKDIKIGSWNGDNTLTAESKDNNYVAFTGLDRIKVTGEIRTIGGGYHVYHEAICGLFAEYRDIEIHNIGSNTYGPGVDTSQPFQPRQEKITKMETKARIPKGEDRYRIVGLKLTTDKDNVWKVNPSYDEITDARVVSEEAPYPGWELKGFYGGQTFFYISRLGPIWGH
jgi:hypothetical protein